MHKKWYQVHQVHQAGWTLMAQQDEWNSISKPGCKDEQTPLTSKVSSFLAGLILPLMAPKQDVPWSDRHKPRHLGEVVGNSDQIRKLAEWLRDWDDVVLRGKKKEIPAPDPKQKFQPPPENLNARAVLVSGPPGIGKTTTCTLVAKCSRFKVMEFNASDARSKAVIDNMTNSLAGNKTLSFGTSSVLQRSAIIMDECDGMTGGDKGGLQALINLIQVSEQCNLPMADVLFVTTIQ